MRVFLILFQLVEITDIFTILHNAVFLELAQGVIVGLGLGDAASSRKYLAIVEVEEGIKARGPVLHSHGDSATGTGLGKIQEGVDQPPQVLQFLAG